MEEDRRSPGGTGSEGTEAGDQPPVSPRVVSRARTLIDIIDAEIPPPYRVELFRILVPGLVTDRRRPTVAEGRPTVARADDGAPAVRPEPRLERTRLDLATYAAVLAQPGKNLLKALVALEVARDQLGIDWMTPAEVERLLADRAGVRSVYRTNLSNALSKAPGMADRRRRGRGYEYRITSLGRETLHREAALLGG